MKLIIVLALALLASVSGARVFRSVVEGKSAYAYWTICPNATFCEYISIQAYDYDTNTVNYTSGATTSDDQPWLYVYHQTSNSETSTWTSRYVNVLTSLPVLRVANNARTARLVLNPSNITLSDGSLVRINLRWLSPLAVGFCNCRQWDYSNGIYTQRITSDSRWSQTDLAGWVKIGSQIYDVPEVVQATVSDWGSKTIYISHA